MQTRGGLTEYFMNYKKISIRDLMRVGAHMGHSTKRWNPEMEPYIFGNKGKVHIINLDLTLPLFNEALKKLYNCALNGGRILFVGTKKQAQEIIKKEALRCGQYYINKRWLGGTLTNWDTIVNSIARLKKYDAIIDDPESGLTKKEMLETERSRNKLDRALGGIRNLTTAPDLVFILDVKKEKIAVLEAAKLNIEIIGIVDTNSSLKNIDYPIPANDDAMRAISYYCYHASEAVLAGINDSYSNEILDKNNTDVTSADTNNQEKSAEISQDTKSQKKSVNANNSNESSSPSSSTTEKNIETSNSQQSSKTSNSDSEKTDSETDPKVVIKTETSKTNQTNSNQVKS